MARIVIVGSINVSEIPAAGENISPLRQKGATITFRAVFDEDGKSRVYVDGRANDEYARHALSPMIGVMRRVFPEEFKPEEDVSA